ncbi:hypothetical protein HK101_010848 [Irineochytrium annulatum]|nr:hypothetical protein HK101_010848 [Irineochytrium annulatum]
MDAALSVFPLGEFASYFMDWKVPVTTAAVYFFTVTYINNQMTRNRAVLASAQKTLKDAQKELAVRKDSAWFKLLVLLHNVALCVFSAACFVGMAPRWVRNFRDRPFWEAYCDRDSSGLFYWSWLFYLSKYYEILDTIILLMKGNYPTFSIPQLTTMCRFFHKGRPSSLLQSYHHAGAIITMFLCVQSQATATWIFVVFNSFIHTIMYFYYACTTLGLHPPKRAKKMLTTMQISQFLVGGTLATSYVVIPGCLKRNGGMQGWMEVLAYGSTIGYLVPLTYLFVDFARRTYAEISRKAAERRVAAAKDTAISEAEIMATAPAAEVAAMKKRRITKTTLSIPHLFIPLLSPIDQQALPRLPGALLSVLTSITPSSILLCPAMTVCNDIGFVGTRASSRQASTATNDPTIAKHRPSTTSRDKANSAASDKAIDDVSGDVAALKATALVIMDDAHLWNAFHSLQNEMIITKGGRNLFPHPNFLATSQMAPEALYTVGVEVVQTSPHRHRFRNGWKPVLDDEDDDDEGDASPQASNDAHMTPCGRLFIHHASPQKGEAWRAMGVISFRAMRLTNRMDETDAPAAYVEEGEDDVFGDLPDGIFRLQSFRAYRLRVHVIRHEKGAADKSEVHEFERTSFVAVTHYQNQKVNALKKNFNPHAKGFKNQERRHNPNASLSTITPAAPESAALPSRIYPGATPAAPPSQPSRRANNSVPAWRTPKNKKRGRESKTSKRSSGSKSKRRRSNRSPTPSSDEDDDEEDESEDDDDAGFFGDELNEDDNNDDDNITYQDGDSDMIDSDSSVPSAHSTGGKERPRASKPPRACDAERPVTPSRTPVRKGGVRAMTVEPAEAASVAAAVQAVAVGDGWFEPRRSSRLRGQPAPTVPLTPPMGTSRPFKNETTAVKAEGKPRARQIVAKTEPEREPVASVEAVARTPTPAVEAIAQPAQVQEIQYRALETPVRVSLPSFATLIDGFRREDPRMRTLTPNMLRTHHDDAPSPPTSMPAPLRKPSTQIVSPCASPSPARIATVESPRVAPSRVGSSSRGNSIQSPTAASRTPTYGTPAMAAYVSPAYAPVIKAGPVPVHSHATAAVLGASGAFDHHVTAGRSPLQLLAGFCTSLLEIERERGAAPFNC